VVLGTALAGMSDAEEDHGRFAGGGARAVNPMLALMIFGGAGSSNVSIELGLGGPCVASSNSCASGNLALGEAARMVRDGTADVMLAGGSEAPLCPLTFSAFDLIHTMSGIRDPSRACCPFSARRDGFVMAEGSAILVLEAEEHARRRGARAYAEFLGAASNSDAWHMTASLASGEQAAACMLAALSDAGVAPSSVDYVNAHASSTPINDRNETVAIHRAFGAHAPRLAISGTKPVHGHALGAVAAMEAAICARAISEGFIPPTANLDEPDPACDLDYVPLKGREARLGVVLSNAFGFGGVNASIVLGRYP
jgi:3-oxoacyl-[acyl-carrier-protein] synthase II